MCHDVHVVKGILRKVRVLQNTMSARASNPLRKTIRVSLIRFTSRLNVTLASQILKVRLTINIC